MQRAQTATGKISLWMYIFVYYLIIGSDCILFCYNQNQTVVKWAQYGMVLVSAVVFAIALLKGGGKKKYLFLFLALIMIVITAVYYGEFSGGYISLIALFTMGTAFFDVIDPNKFKKVFLNLMTAICVASLLTWLFSSAFLKLSFFPSIYNVLGREYRFYFLSNISVIDPTRNYGLFTEPSRFQAYLNLSLIFLLFDTVKKLDIKRIVLFIITLLTTFSTTGYIAFALIVIAFVLSPKVSLRMFYKVLLMVVLGVVIAVMFNSNEDFAWAITKVTAGEKSRSAATRFNSLYANLVVIFESFPLGTGIQNANSAFAEALDSLGNLYASTNTVTLLIYFVKFGFVVGLYYFVNMIKGVRNISNGANTLLLVFAFIVMTSGITMIESILFSIIVFYPQTYETQEDKLGTQENV